MRVVSLLPSATEILCLIGGEGLLVGRSHECDFPPSIRSRPALTSSTLASAAAHANGPGASVGGAGGGGGVGGVDSAAIDREVREALSAGRPLYHVDEAMLRDLRPDVILTQDLCSVCSIDLESVRRVAESLPSRPRIVSLNPETFEGVLDDVLTVGRAVGLEDAATTAVVRLRERMFEAGEYVNPFADGPVVVFLEWLDPLFIGGHWTPQLIERAGGRHPLNATAARETAGAAIGPQMAERVAGKSIRVPREAVEAVGAEAIVICPCGLTLDQTREAYRRLASEAWFARLPAVRHGRVALVDGNQYFNRPGPRLVDAFEFLVGWLNDRPERIPTGFAWERGR